MITRCENKNIPGYADYGGRGITICPSWRNSFEAFLSDMGECPPGLSLDRFPNNDGNYEPGNCRWANTYEQARNRRNNRVFTISGKTGCLSELAEHFKIDQRLVWNRINARWTPEKAFLTPVRFMRKP